MVSKRERIKIPSKVIRARRQYFLLVKYVGEIFRNENFIAIIPTVKHIGIKNAVWRR